MTEFGEIPDHLVDRDLIRSVQGAIDRAVINGLYKLGLSPAPAMALDEEERHMLLEAHDDSIWNRRFSGDYNDPKGRFNTDIVITDQFEAHELSSLLPGQWGAIGRIVTMSSPELYGNNGSRLYRSPMKCIDLRVGDTQQAVEEWNEFLEIPEQCEYSPRYWEILIQPDSPPLIIKAEDYLKLTADRQSDGFSPEDGGWIKAFQHAQRRDQSEGLGLFQMLSPPQCRELIVLINTVKNSLRVT